MEGPECQDKQETHFEEPFKVLSRTERRKSAVEKISGRKRHGWESSMRRQV